MVALAEDGSVGDWTESAFEWFANHHRGQGNKVVKLVERDPKADAVVRAAVKLIQGWQKHGADAIDFTTLLPAVLALQSSRAKARGRK